MFELSWQQFSRQPSISKLPINEQIRQFQFAQQRFAMQQQYIANTMVAGGGGGNLSINSYVEDDYIDNYFE
jgi:hypothetical protein